MRDIIEIREVVRENKEVLMCNNCDKCPISHECDYMLMSDGIDACSWLETCQGDDK